MIVKTDAVLAKYYNDLPEEIKFKLDESARYNKSILKNYLLSIEY